LFVVDEEGEKFPEGQYKKYNQSMQTSAPATICKSAPGTNFTSWSQHHFVVISKHERQMSTQSFTLWQQATIESTLATMIRLRR